MKTNPRIFIFHMMSVRPCNSVNLIIY